MDSLKLTPQQSNDDDRALVKRMAGGDTDALREFYGRLQEPKEFVQIDRANHLFEGQAPEVGDALEELLVDFSCTTR